MNVIINGRPCQLTTDATVAQAVRAVTTITSGVAAALNNEVVSRTAWDITQVAEGDRVEVLIAVQGG